MLWYLIHSWLFILTTAVAGTPSPTTFCSAVLALIVEPPCCCSLGSVIDSKPFGVSYRCFLDLLFNCYRPVVAGVAPPCIRVRHDRHCARSSRCWVLILPPIDASCCREHIRALSVVGDITGQSHRCHGQRRRLMMTGGVMVSVTQRSK